MDKAITQGSLIGLVFFASWFLLSRIDWVKHLNVKKHSKNSEEKIGDTFWEFFESTGTEITSPFAIRSMDSLVNKICNANNIERKKIKTHLLLKDEVNAFALPNGHLVVYSGLILASDNQEELCGVLGHEIAHIQQGHVMKKMVKDIGLATLLSATTGSQGGEVIKQIAEKVSSSAFDRSLEQEADLKSVDYLLKAEIDPEPFADFLYKLSSENEEEAMKYFSWMNTHPASKERAEYIIEHIKNRPAEFKHVMAESTWIKLKDKMNLEE